MLLGFGAMFRLLAVLVLAVLAAACSGSSDLDTTTTSAAPITAVAPATTAGFTRNEAGFVDGLKKREPERFGQLDQAAWLKWGDQACTEMADGVKGATDDLEKAMVAGGVESELAKRTASDVANAAAGNLCDPPGAL